MVELVLFILAFLRNFANSWSQGRIASGLTYIGVKAYSEESSSLQEKPYPCDAHTACAVKPANCKSPLCVTSQVLSSSSLALSSPSNRSKEACAESLSEGVNSISDKQKVKEMKDPKPKGSTHPESAWLKKILLGASAGQSLVLQTFDALLGVCHESGKCRLLVP
ncbi:unnamed protein product [Protopolystoma xenopodis]|uniref:Uncharacterized protein n=1 Tax=Protopolystoma xenopodis TaxID=117903 RepID=A0A448WIG9_9PLAT|nr:unnamed protein product [Protopolystoma xenopodis]